MVVYASMMRLAGHEGNLQFRCFIFTINHRSSRSPKKIKSIISDATSSQRFSCGRASGMRLAKILLPPRAPVFLSDLFEHSFALRYALMVVVSAQEAADRSDPI